MSLRKKKASVFSARQKLIVFSNSSISAEAALLMDRDEITFELFIRNGISALEICAAGITPVDLKEIGVGDASKLRRLGFDALHLANEEFLVSACMAWGATDLIKTFLVSASDAVCLAASSHLNIEMELLLAACAGAPQEAAAVISQTTSSLAGVSSRTLLDTGLRMTKLKSLGISLCDIQQLTGLTSEHLIKLGYLL
jgi:hypothetical protein